MKVLMTMIPAERRELMEDLVAILNSAFVRCKPAEARSAMKAVVCAVNESGETSVILSEDQWARYLESVRSVCPEYSFDMLLDSERVAQVVAVKEQLEDNVRILFLDAMAAESDVLEIPFDEEVLGGNE